MNNQEMLQYLNPEGEITTPLPDNFKNTEWLQSCYRNMVRARLFDSKAIALQRTGQLGTYASLQGAEAIDVTVAMAMNSEDVLVPYYRNHACQMIRGMPMNEILLYWGGDERGNSSPEQGKDLPNAVPIATQSMHACGIASAIKIRNQSQAVVSLIGDGGTSKGDFMEALNIAGVWQLPVVFVINNNQWAISVPRALQCAAERLADKGVAAGINNLQVDGNDPIAMAVAMEQALAQAYEGKGPTLIEAISYRLSDHTTADDATRYRDSQELKDAWERDPVKRLRNYMLQQGLWDEDLEKQLVDQLGEEIQGAINLYLDTPPQPVESMFDHLYAELPDHLIEQRDWATVRAMPGGSHHKEESS